MPGSRLAIDQRTESEQPFATAILRKWYQLVEPEMAGHSAIAVCETWAEKAEVRIDSLEHSICLSASDDDCRLEITILDKETAESKQIAVGKSPDQQELSKQLSLFWVWFTEARLTEA